MKIDMPLNKETKKARKFHFTLDPYPIMLSVKQGRIK